MTLARSVVGGGLLAIIAVSVITLSQGAPRRSGTNMTPDGAFVEGLISGSTACQSQELLPADTSAVRMTIGTDGRPGPQLSVRVGGRGGQTLTTGTLAAGWRQGVVRIPVAHVSTATGETRLCLRNDGPTPIALAGDSPDGGYQLEINGRTIENQHLRIDYMRPGSESWFALLPTIVHRFTLAKANLVRGWAWLAAPLLMLAAMTVAIRAIVKADP